MKAYRIFALIVINICLIVLSVSTLQLIDTQRGLGEKQDALLGEVNREDEILASIIPDFRPTEEMVAKTEVMVADLKTLESTVIEMNDIVARLNTLLPQTVALVNVSNAAVEQLGIAMAAVLPPLTAVSDKTTVTLGFMSATVSQLQQMSAGLASQNAHASNVANMMEGNF
ncbi:MAG: hypothetical protein ACYC55_05845 [Candidatus Geothermincolia bacterium]